jgi:hypothetical protein
MRCPATGGVGACGVDGGAALLDVDDFPFLIHYEGGAIGHAGLWYQNAVSFGHFAVEEIAQQWERCVELGGKFFLGGGVVCTNAKNFGFVAFKFCNTSLVCCDFAGSATCKSGGKKCQYYGVFTAETGKGYLSALGGWQSKVGRHIAFLQRGVGRLNVLGEETRREQAGCKCKWLPHSLLSYSHWVLDMLS